MKDPFRILVLLVAIVGLILVFRIPSEILHKAGFSRGWTFLVVLSGYVGLIAFALIEWPIHRELAWHRFRAGDVSEETVELVEAYATNLEKAGEGKKADEVFRKLAQKTSADVADYYENCIRRVRKKIEATEVA